MKRPDSHRIAEHYAAILAEIGADFISEGIKETPLRAAKHCIVPAKPNFLHW